MHVSRVSIPLTPDISHTKTSFHDVRHVLQMLSLFL